MRSLLRVSIALSYSLGFLSYGIFSYLQRNRKKWINN